MDVTTDPAADADELLIGCGDLRPGRRLGRYELLAPVGRGGMAVVWAARLSGSRGFSKLVALKTLLPALSADPRFEKMFLAEARLASSLEHANVCEVLDLGESDGLLYMVMEWVNGDSLAALMAAHAAALPPEVAARIALDVARGLSAAHGATDSEGAALGIVHRDVSPHNILIGTDGVSKIADFGIAKIEGGDNTGLGYAKGKVRYMAPEQVYCEKLDHRTDVFALGVVLYEATTGVHPFAAASDVATLAAIASPDEARRPSEIVTDYPSALECVVMRAIAKEVDDRHASLDEFARELEAAIDVSEPNAVAELLTTSCGAAIKRRQQRLEAVRETLSGELPVASARITPTKPPPRLGYGVALGVLAIVGVVLFALTRAASPAESKEPPVARPESVAAAVNAPAAPQPSPAPPTSEVARAEVEPVNVPPRTRVVAKSSPPSASARAPAAPKASVSGRTSGVLETRE